MEIASQAELDLKITFRVTEAEARALEAMAGYGADAFIKTFYSGLGEAYMKEHEKGLRSFLATIKIVMPQHLAAADEARKAYRRISGHPSK